jgi:peptidoglycan/xylan/chitin deacetylase (PgdA/CDA1 family)
MASWRPTPFIRVSLALHALGVLVLLLDFELWPWVLGVLVANHLAITLLGLLPRSRALGSNWTQLPATAAARREIALTLDDGPDPEVTPHVLDLLDDYGIKATFFCIGRKAEQYPDLCREIVARGHAVENHSQRHRHHFSLLGPAGFEREIRAGQETLQRITGTAPMFFRAPAGLRNPFLDPVLAKLGLQLANWTVRGFDTRTRDAAKVKARLLRGLRPGAILLLHDGHAARTATGEPVVLAVLPELVAAAQAAGLRFVTLRDATL